MTRPMQYMEDEAKREVEVGRSGGLGRLRLSAMGLPTQDVPGWRASVC
jgi:hypothetical protein